jgi:hypothetical protein
VALQEVAQGDFLADLPVVEGLHGHRIPEDARSPKLFAGPDDALLLARFVNLDSSRSGEPHHPDQTGSGAEQLPDLGGEIGLVLARVRVLHR